LSKTFGNKSWKRFSINLIFNRKVIDKTKDKQPIMNRTKEAKMRAAPIKHHKKQCTITIYIFVANFTINNDAYPL